jgi:ABC-2 type transport system ATP-binding protein
LCDRVIVIAEGSIVADASPSQLTTLMQLPSLEKVFAQLVRQQDTQSTAREMVDVMRMA